MVKLFLSISLLYLPLLLQGQREQDPRMDTLAIASIQQHPAWELFPCHKKSCYVGLHITARTILSREYLQCQLCNRFFQVSEQISFIVVYTDGVHLAAHFAHVNCIEKYQNSKIKKE